MARIFVVRFKKRRSLIGEFTSADHGGDDLAAPETTTLVAIWRVK
jgi:hypothetical protein